MSHALTPKQFTALVLVETRATQCAHESKLALELEAPALAKALADAAASLERAKAAFLAESQRTVSIAAPADVKALVGG